MSTIEIGSFEELEARLEAAERTAGDALRVAQAYRKMVEGWRELEEHEPSTPMPPAVTPATIAAFVPMKLPVENAPRGREAITRIVTARPGMWTLAELRDEMKRRGWWTSDKAVEVAVHRLARAGKARKVRNGLYEFPPGYVEERDAA
jgi:hypothetical protein